MAEKVKVFILGTVTGTLVTALLAAHLGLSFIRAGHLQAVRAEILYANIAMQGKNLESVANLQMDTALCSIEHFEDLESGLYFFQSDKESVSSLRSSIKPQGRGCSSTDN
ncbi:MAG: hypothetical protein KJ556_00985 [Gammaproteobacteria bacterium]|nr:hypothetical protein [Gammaproteobacteria bacterium]MBU2059128.1 hypothetical protein [Gammaproteobacteria bacterium]MBU2173679.1 hypothetical protein [Gammaproteobacteria bacterium]MBU2246835.1 hypothetical protein [Gammaproteobacteria bacterium]MBU2345351.1 hypothetical protein [Gammaproteobacteria bacterium]